MKAHPFPSRHLLQYVALVLATLVGKAATAQAVEFDANCAPQMTRQQERLNQKANAGIDVLRQFVFIRRAILQVDVYETATWAESLNAARGSCMQKAATAVNAQPTASS